MYADSAVGGAGWPTTTTLATTDATTWADIVIAKAPPTLTAWASVAPTIDGVVGASEWAGASNEKFSIGWTYVGELWVMNDATNLYLAVKITDTSFAAADLLAFLFDNNNNGVFEEAGDDALGLWASLAAFTDGFVNRPGDVSPDTDHGGTSDGQGRSSASGGFNYFEISHPLDSADDVHDFSLAAGNTVGFYLSYMKASGVYGGMWPFSDPLTSLFTTTITTTTNWAHVTVASAGGGPHESRDRLQSIDC